MINCNAKTLGTDIFASPHSISEFPKVQSPYVCESKGKHARACTLSLSHAHTLIQTSGLTKAFVSFTSRRDSLGHPAQSFVTGGQCVPHTNQLAEMLNLAEFEIDADFHICAFKTHLQPRNFWIVKDS